MKLNLRKRTGRSEQVIGEGASLHGGGAMLSVGVLPSVLLHGAGVAGFDELAIFGGIGVIILGLIYLSWRSGRKRKRAGGTRRRSR